VEQSGSARILAERQILYHACERLPARHSLLAALRFDDDRLVRNFAEETSRPFGSRL
jgi:hypothetical protein